MTSQDLEKKDLPDKPGVYFFMGPDEKVLYVGKATSLHDRVKSYFSKDLRRTRSELVVQMVNSAVDVEYRVTDSVLEALLLEANLIKTLKPWHNTQSKDDKSFNYVVFTEEKFPQVLLVRGRELAINLDQESNVFTLENKKFKVKAIYGPFPHGGQLREALKIIRRIFPYRDHKCTPAYQMIERGKSPKPCFNRHLGLCPGVCTGEISEKGYAKQIANIRLFFEGKKQELVQNLEKDMKKCAKAKEFESAERVKRTIFALQHIQDISLIREEVKFEIGHPDTVRHHTYRIEAYDIAHMSGGNLVGVMVVVEDGEIKKSDYRKFRIRGTHGTAVDDTNNLKEILVRRLRHPEWPMPNLIVIDGGQGQLNAAKAVIIEKNVDIELVSVVKDERHKPKDFLGKKGTIDAHSKAILLANSEAHRFAIAYHRNRRDSAFGLR